jgi:hypothetical protein
VSFDIIQGDKGMQADDVRLLRTEGHPKVTTPQTQETVTQVGAAA